MHAHNRLINLLYPPSCPLCRARLPAHSAHSDPKRPDVICEKCHSVAEFDNCDLADLFKAVQKRTGYKIEDHWLELFGLCPNCR